MMNMNDIEEGKTYHYEDKKGNLIPVTVIRKNELTVRVEWLDGGTLSRGVLTPDRLI